MKTSRNDRLLIQINLIYNLETIKRENSPLSLRELQQLNIFNYFENLKNNK